MAQTGEPVKDIIIFASIHELSPRINTVTHMASLSLTEHRTHIWLVNSATFSHLSGNLDLFHDLYNIPLVINETASRESFTTNQRGMSKIAIVSDPMFNLADI